MKKQSKYIQEETLFDNLENFQSIDLEKDWMKVEERIDFKKSRRIPLLWRAAAIAILLLGIGFLANRYIIKTPELLIASSLDGRKEIILSDGSTVFLNENSELAYPEKFRRNHREVRLVGEGYFQVTPDPEKPFLVNVADWANVEVLGTSFNIQSAMELETVKVQVVEGKVAFSAAHSTGQPVILVREDQAVLQSGSIKKNSQVDRNFLSWKTGILYFNQDPIEKVVEELSGFYNQEFVLQVNPDQNLIYTSTIDNQDLASVLEELELILGVSTAREEGRVIITLP